MTKQEMKREFKEALAMDIAKEIKERWGNQGVFSSNCKRPNGKRSFRVGYIECGFFNVVGEGGSWQEALVKADSKRVK